jgi:hypothetical protein
MFTRSNVKNIRFDDEKNPLHIDHFRKIFCDEISARLFWSGNSTNELRKISERLRTRREVFFQILPPCM